MTIDARLLLAPAFLVAQLLAVHYIAGVEHPPAPPSLAGVPARLGDWLFAGDDPIAPDVADQLGADRLLSRVYRSDKTGAVAYLLVAWFQTQRGGARQPHSPRVCLPAAGWTPLSTGEMNLPTASGPIRVNRYIASNGARHAAAIYWYETPRRVIANEWAAKFWVVADGVRDRRTDTALVRVFVSAPAGSDAEIERDAADLSSQAEPALRRILPRL